jgi:outer membrane biosynthesis protein TonB
MKTPASHHELLLAERFAGKLAAGQPQKPMQRRVFLKLSGAGGLALGWACASDKPHPTGMDSMPSGMTNEPPEIMQLEPAPGEEAAEPPPAEPEAPPAIQYDINAYVRVGSDESVTLYVAKARWGRAY